TRRAERATSGNFHTVCLPGRANYSGHSPNVCYSTAPAARENYSSIRDHPVHRVPGRDATHRPSPVAANAMKTNWLGIFFQVHTRVLVDRPEGFVTKANPYKPDRLQAG